jgi:hypothetical protein
MKVISDVKEIKLRFGKNKTLGNNEAADINFFVRAPLLGKGKVVPVLD